MIEVEKRVLLSKNEAESFVKKLNLSKYKVKEFKRFTMIYIDYADFTPNPDNPIDLRVRTTKDSAKLTVKYGSWHSDSGRQEYEVEFTKESIKELFSILLILGFKYFVITYITRKEYHFEDFVITIDEYHHNKECLMEVELLAKDEDEAKIFEQKIFAFLNKYNLKYLEKDEMINFVQKLNDIKDTRVDLTKTKIDDWYEKWKDFIYCKI